MPEGPECRIIAKGLNHKLQNNNITRIQIVSGRYAKKAPSGFDAFKSNLPWTVRKVGVKGKFIWFDLESQGRRRVVFHTLGMTGGWTQEKTPATRIILEYNDTERLYFNDQRNFGTLKFQQSLSDLQEKLTKGLGHDFLDSDMNFDSVLKLLKLKRNSTKTLPEVLMNQKNFAGVGNYVKAEVLYRARLSPHRTPSELSETEVQELIKAISDVLRASFASKKTELVDYRDMQECGQEFRKVVYKQPLDPLGNPVRAEETKDKRTTYWVPAVQK